MRNFYKIFFLLALSQFFIFSGFSQDSTGTIPDGVSEIKLSTTVDRQQVPKNRMVTFTAHLEWFGNLAAYKIVEIKNPDVENFEIVRNAAAHRTEIINGKPIAIKKLEFTLQPLSLGMGYVGDMLIRYQNVITGDEGQLMTNRLSVKIVDAVPEPGSHFLFIPLDLWLPILSVLFGIVVLGLIFWRWQVYREKRRLARAAQATQVSVEEKFLEALKTNIDLNSSDSVNQFAGISRIYRQYLAEKYEIQALEATTSNILKSLRRFTENEKKLEEATEVLNTCDLAKFSGGGPGNAELARVYTLVENFLENPFEPIELNQENEHIES